MRQDTKVEAIGGLIKTIVISPENVEEFFDQVIKDNLILEDIILEWTENSSSILFPINQYKSQIYLMKNDIKIYSFEINGVTEEFIFLEEVDRLGVEHLKNKEELSGEGKLITPFMLKFSDFSKKYLINLDQNPDFFDLPKNGIILNDVRLIMVGKPKPRLTGRAAEIAKRKGEL